MCQPLLRYALAIACSLSLVAPQAIAQEDDGLSAERVLQSIERAKKALASRQNADGSWPGMDRWKVGTSSLALLALINAGMTAEDPEVQKGLRYLRNVKEPDPSMIYEISLMAMALAAAKDGQTDTVRLVQLAQKLEDAQIKNGESTGSWSYSVERGGFLDLGGDRSNAQYAILGLHEAAEAGVPVDREVWQRAKQHWLDSQNADGGWGYTGVQNRASPSTGSMTVAGIASLVIVQDKLRDDGDVTPEGRPICCEDKEPDDIDKALDRAIRWLTRNFAVGHNPQSSNWLLYYLYGLERAGRLGGLRFFGDHDWYREGAAFLVASQNPRTGAWSGTGSVESDEVVGTSFALLFLSKGLAPVLINKLQYGPIDPTARGVVLDDNWNQHRDDIRNLTNLVSGLDKWPKLVTWQTLNLNRVLENGSVQDLKQAPVLFIGGRDEPDFDERSVELFRQYIDQGGFIFAVANCNAAGFDGGIRKLIEQMYPQGEAQLKRLEPDHVVFRSHYPLDAEAIELWGVDIGCRTAIIYSPEDLACLWNKWMRQDPPKRHPELKSSIIRATKIGVNVVAYATGREPPIKLKVDGELVNGGEQDRIERGFLQIAKLRHSGTWDAAPQALRNLLMALNRTVGPAASTTVRELPPTDDNIYRYPILYMHGRNRFDLGAGEREQLRTYLERGGVLFADACCGDQKFDDSFREMVAQLFPESRLERIPADHEMFTASVGHDIRRVRRRMPEADNPNVALELSVREVEPFLEGIQIDGRWAIIYSKYDISCALERQASVACAGYLPEDAVRIGINVILYAMLQDATYAESMK